MVIPSISATHLGSVPLGALYWRFELHPTWWQALNSS